MKIAWQTKKLNEICDKASSNISQNQLTKEEGIYPIFGAGGFIKNINFFQRDKDYISIIKDGAGIGRVSILPAKSSVIGTLQYIIPKENIDLKFLYYIMNSFNFSKYKNGATIPHIYFREYSEEQFVIPPISEQKRIVKILDEAFEKIEKAKENAENNLQNSKELFESYLQNVFANPGKNWGEKSLGEVCFLITKGSSPKWQGIKYVEEPGILFITSENVGDGRLILDKRKYVEEKFNKKDKKSILKKGDVLTNIVGASIGRTAIFDLDDVSNINQAVCILRCKPEVIFNKYLMNLLNSPFLKIILHSNEVNTARANLSLGFFSNLSIPFPPLFEQKSIVKKLDTLSEQTKKLEEVYKQKLADLEELKKSVLNKAFKGEL